MKCVLLLILIKSIFCLYDSYLNHYKTKIFKQNEFNDIANTTWKEFFISENVKNLVKCIPAYIDNDNEQDLLILDSETRLYWLSNIRGTSKAINYHFISSSKLYDFVISNEKNIDGKMFILGINSMRDKVLKFISHRNELNSTLEWKEETFFDINQNSLSKDSKIVSLNINKISENKKLLLVGLENLYDGNTILIKMIMENDEISNNAVINFQKNVLIICSYDMDNDGFYDILYMDNKNNLYVLYNDDPNYLSIFITTLNTITINNIPRIFIIDSDRDGYPDIVTNDKGQNTIGLYFNKGKEYWTEIKKFFRENKYNKDLVYKKISWNFIPLIDIYEEHLNGKIIRDFTVLKIESKSRINFEVFILYSDQLVWFIEKKIDIKLLKGKKIEQNYNYCMHKCDIVLDQTKNIVYNMIMDIDINNDKYPEFIFYSENNNSLHWINKYKGYITGFGWNSNFWIYLIIYIYIVSSIVGFFQFYKLKMLNDRMNEEKLLKGRLQTNSES